MKPVSSDRGSHQPAIHPLSGTDAARLSALLRSDDEAYKQHFTPFPFDKPSLYKRLSTSKRDRYWGMINDGELVAFFMLRGFDEGYKRPSFGVYVAQQWNGRGLATQALQYALMWCKEHKVPAVMLKVHDKNTRARRVYEAMGFQLLEHDKDTGQAVMEIRLTS
jgi:RimJ/RimL family protein N-acetyltransferase